MQTLLKQIFPSRTQDGIRGLVIGTPLESILKKEGSNELFDYFVKYRIPLETGHEIVLYYLVDLSKESKPLRITQFFYNHNLGREPNLNSFNEFSQAIYDLLKNELGEPVIDENSENMKKPDLIWEYPKGAPTIRYDRLIYKDKTLTHTNMVLKLVYSEF